MSRWCSPGVRAAILAGNEPAWLLGHMRRSYVRAAILATPPWVKRRDFAAVYRKARDACHYTGSTHVVDHIVPLVHPYVCGLNVPWNLRVIPYAVNCAKSNSFMPDQLELPVGLTSPYQRELTLGAE